MEQVRPKKVKTYENAKIYKIWNEVDDEIYVGKTCKLYLSQRLSKHRKDFKYYIVYNNGMKIYPHMEKHGFDKFHIELLEKIEDCKDCDTYNQREGYWVRKLKPSLNTNIPGRTKKEYYEDNKEVILEKQKQYNVNNAEKISTNKKEYYGNNQEQILTNRKEYYENNSEKCKAKVRQYSINNKQMILEKARQYYKDNREKIRERQKIYRNNKKLLLKCEDLIQK